MVKTFHYYYLLCNDGKAQYAKRARSLMSMRPMHRSLIDMLTNDSRMYDIIYNTFS